MNPAGPATAPSPHAPPMRGRTEHAASRCAPSVIAGSPHDMRTPPQATGQDGKPSTNPRLPPTSTECSVTPLCPFDRRPHWLDDCLGTQTPRVPALSHGQAGPESAPTSVATAVPHSQNVPGRPCTDGWMDEWRETSVAPSAHRPSAEPPAQRRKTRSSAGRPGEALP